MSSPNLNFFPNGMSEIITSTLSEGNGKSETQKPETPVTLSSNIYNLNMRKLKYGELFLHIKYNLGLLTCLQEIISSWKAFELKNKWYSY